MNGRLVRIPRLDHNVVWMREGSNMPRYSENSSMLWYPDIKVEISW
jgi:hypothetical protein